MLEDRRYKYVVRTQGNATSEMVATVLYLMKTKPKFSTIAVVNQDYAWGRDSWEIFINTLKVFNPDVKASRAPRSIRRATTRNSLRASSSPWMAAARSDDIRRGAQCTGMNVRANARSTNQSIAITAITDEPPRITHDRYQARSRSG